LESVREWLDEIGFESELTVASSDASFRRYYRFAEGEKSYIVMDSSLQKDSLSAFVDMTDRLKAVGVRVPGIYLQNMDDGFLLMEDLGSVDLLKVLNDHNYEKYYGRAIDEIVKMQRASTDELPLYDAEFLHFEMGLMQEWYLEKYLGKTLNEDGIRILNDTIELVVREVLSQPQEVFVHRDFHSRNIMITPDDELAAIDYQDARDGAITYDLVSLLRDCYIDFEPKEMERLALSFRDKKGLNISDETFIRWFDFMGLQRHIKVLGIFSRLYLRDGKEGYLADIPLTLKYVKDISAKYKEMRPLMNLFEKLEVPE